MGLFGALGKVLAGKPVYVPQDQSTQPNDGQPPVPQPGQATGKVVPVVRFGRIECPGDGQRLDVYADARNDSVVPVFLDWITLCGARRQLDVQLRPGEVQQLLVYSGPLLQNRPNGYAEVQYRTADTGDYFTDYHEVRSEQEGTAGYRITELLQRGPVKDI